MPSVAHLSARACPSEPRTRSKNGESVTWKPVATTRTSAGCSVPSAVVMPPEVTRSIGEVTRSTLSRDSAGYQVLESRMRLQPISNRGMTFSRSVLSRTCSARCARPRTFIGASAARLRVRPTTWNSRLAHCSARIARCNPGIVRYALRSMAG